MNFIKVLKGGNLGNDIPFIEGMTPRVFDAIQINDDLCISIQASYGHYCNPRTTLKDLSKYTTMEFALLNSEDQFLSVRHALPDFLRLEEIEGHFDNSVYGNVSVELIEELYQSLIRHYSPL